MVGAGDAQQAAVCLRFFGSIQAAEWSKTLLWARLAEFSAPGFYRLGRGCSGGCVRELCVNVLKRQTQDPKPQKFPPSLSAKKSDIAWKFFAGPNLYLWNQNDIHHL